LQRTTDLYLSKYILMFSKLLLTGSLLASALLVQSQVEVDKPITLTGTGADGKITGIQSVTLPADATSAEVVQSGSLSYAAASGSSNAFAITLSPAPAAYAEGMEVRFRANHAISGPATVNVNGLGAKSIVKNISTPLGNCDIAVNQIVAAVYDGTNFQLISPTYLASVDATAGPDQLVYGSSTTLAGNDPAPGTGAWTVQSGVGGSFANATLYNTTFSGTIGVTYTLRWTVTGTCGVTDFDDVIITFDTPTKRVFMTTSSGTGDFNSWANSGGLTGLAAADRICQYDASNPLGPGAGNWKAWVSTSTVHAKNRIQDAVYKRTDNTTVIAINKADLLDGSLLNPITASNVPVFTGTNPAGDYNASPFFSNPSPNASCNDWTTSSNSGTNAIYGRSNGTNGEWTLYTFNYGCNPSTSGLGAMGRLYCFED
jgi:hypothetical protein